MLSNRKFRLISKHLVDAWLVSEMLKQKFCFLKQFHAPLGKDDLPLAKMTLQLNEDSVTREAEPEESKPPGANWLQCIRTLN